MRFFSLLLSFAPAVASAQTLTLTAPPIRITAKPSCPACTIELQRVVTLQDDAGHITGPQISIVRGNDGAIYTIDMKVGLPTVFASNGHFVRQLGRKGGGPGEYQGAQTMLVGADGRLHVFDARLGRRTIVAPTGQVVSTIPMPVGRGGVHGALLLANGHLVIAGSEVSPGSALQELDEKGTIVNFFSRDSSPGMDGLNRARLLATHANGGIWSGRPYSFLVELYARDRTIQKAFVRVPAGITPIAPGQQPSDGVYEMPPTPMLQGLWEDQTGLLWMVSLVPSPLWKPGQTFAQWRASGTAWPAGMQRPRYDTVIEVLDPATGTLVASMRFDKRVSYILGNGYLASYREGASGTPIVEVWRAELRR